MPQSKISWTDEAVNFWTWNCNKVSEGCKFCYAQTHSQKYPQNSAGGQFLGNPALREKAFEELRLTKPGRAVFINTHSDTFHESVPDEWLHRLFDAMNQRTDLIFLLLTKRPQITELIGEQLRWGDHIWLGTSIELQKYYTSRLNPLLNTPAKHLFVSFEPLLGPIEPDARLQRVDWMIVGGESGDNHRAFGRQWAVDLRDYAAQHGIPFYFKQGGSLFPDQDRLLEGQTYDARPPQFTALHDRFTVRVEQGNLF